MNFFTFFLILLMSQCSLSTKTTTSTADKTNNEKYELILKDIINSPSADITIYGSPSIVDSPYGEAVFFNGENDGMLINQMPLIAKNSFTIEACFYPAKDGLFAQRFIHFGEPFGSRILFETRNDNTNWYFDAHYQTENEKKTLIDSTLLHPLEQWYHVALINNNGILSTYINGKKELEKAFTPSQLDTGKISLGVRQNKVSWFKGAIYNITVSPKVLSPEEFKLTLENQKL